MHHSRKA